MDAYPTASLRVGAPGPGVITFASGATKLELHPDGRVVFTGSADQAARDLWTCLEKIGCGIAAENSTLKDEIAQMRKAA